MKTGIMRGVDAARLLGSRAFSTTTVANDERIHDAEDSVTAHPIPLFKSVAP